MGELCRLLASMSSVLALFTVTAVSVSPASAAQVDDAGDGGSETSAASAACQLSPANFRASVDALAGRGQASWVASDGFTSTRIDANRVLFVNHDTFWGTSDGANHMKSGLMISNSLLIHDDRNPNCFTAQAGPGGSSFFGPPVPGRWLWPGTPTMQGDLVVLPFSHMGSSIGQTVSKMSWDFAQRHVDVRSFRWNGSTLVPSGASPRALTPLSAEPPGGQFEWVGSMVEGPWVYLTPTHLRTGQWGHDIFLARVPASVWFATDGTSIASHLEFRTASGWKRGATYQELLPIVRGTGDAMASITKGSGEVHVIFKEYSIIGTTLVDYHAPTFDGPFTKHELAKAPIKPDTYSYWGVVHPSLGNKGLTRKVTVNFNNAVDMGFGNLRAMDRYRPEMIEVVLPELIRVSTGRPNSAVAVNLTVTGSARTGYVTAFPCGTKEPLASNLNFARGQTVANAAIVKTDAAGEFCVYGSTGVHLVADYWGVDTVSSVGPPVRRLDTRLTHGPTGGQRVAADGTVRVPTGQPGGSTVFGNVTVTDARSAGYTTVFPCDQSRPLTSSNNFQEGQVSATFAAVKTDERGDVCVSSSAEAHVVVDVVGHTAQEVSVVPERVMDSRWENSPTGGTRVRAGEVIEIPTSAAGNAVMGSLTVAGGLDRGYLTAYPCDATRPATSSINFQAMTNAANLVISDTDAQGRLCVYTTADAHVIFDEMAVTPDVATVVPQRLRDTRLN